MFKRLRFSWMGVLFGALFLVCTVLATSVGLGGHLSEYGWAAMSFGFALECVGVLLLLATIEEFFPSKPWVKELPPAPPVRVYSVTQAEARIAVKMMLNSAETLLDYLEEREEVEQ
jgi:MFS family permease